MARSDIMKLPVLGNRVNLKCPACGKKKKVDVGKFRHRKDHLKAKCTCLSIFSFKPVFPKISASDSRNYGYFTNLSMGAQKNKMTIINCSSSGIQFRIQSLQVPRKADKMIIEYKDQYTKKTVKRQGTVHRILGKTVSAFFTR